MSILDNSFFLFDLTFPQYFPVISEILNDYQKSVNNI